MRRIIIIIHLSDGRKLKIPDTWNDMEQRWEWTALKQFMKDGRTFFPSNNCDLAINPAQIVTAERRKVDE